MKIEQIYTGCLAQGAYYIESEGEVAIIDPLRETAPYVEKAKEDKASIKYIFETHFHADFVSGHVDLAKQTGATIVYGPNAETNYNTHIANDGEEFKLGKLTIKTLHTPGHTMESTTYLLVDENQKPYCIFSGDTLFIGDVGRPDLAQKGSEITQEDLAGILYDSLREKIMPLPDDVIVYPAHGAGSACGKNMSKETWDTLGNQKKANYALDEKMSKTDFIKALTTGILPPPQYFSKNVALNKKGYPSIHEVIETGTVALDINTFKEITEHRDALILDTRTPEDFAKSHIPNSIYIGLDGSFAPWVGAMITDIEQPIVFIAPEGREEEVVTRLARVGYDNTLGYLNGGLEAWAEAGEKTEVVNEINTEDFIALDASEINIVDVRKPSEFASGHVQKATNLPLDFIHDNNSKYKESDTYYIHCQGGYRSMIAISILKAKGYKNLINVLGGFGAIKKTSTEILV